MNFRFAIFRRTRVLPCVVIVCAAVTILPSAVFAAPILPGFDYFNTPPGGATVDLGMGPIPLVGVPLPNFALNLADTVVARKDPGPPEGGTGLIDIELVALHLKSVAPVDIDGPGGAPPGDLHITIDASDRFFTGITSHPDGTGTGPSLFNLPTVPTPDSIGNMTMTHGGPGPHTGATMRACFGNPTACNLMPSGFGVGLGVPGGGIFASAFLVIPGGNPSNPLDVLGSMPAPQVTLASSGTYVHTLSFPSEYGGVGLSIISHDGPHPHAEPVPDHITPEPASALLVLLGVIGVGSVQQRRRRG